MCRLLCCFQVHTNAEHHSDGHSKKSAHPTASREGSSAVGWTQRQDTLLKGMVDCFFQLGPAS